MASNASSIQPRAAANKVRRCPGVACLRSWIGPIAMREGLYQRNSCEGTVVSPIWWNFYSKSYPHAPQPSQIPLRLSHIPPDLFFQGFDRRKLDLIAQAIQKMKFDFGLGRQFKRMKIQQVRFNGKRVGAKSRTVPNIRDRIEAFVAHARAGDIDAVFRNNLFVARQVNRRDSVFRSVTAPAPGGRENAEGTRQQMASPADAARGNQFPNVAAGNIFPAQPHFEIIVHFKSHLASQVAQHLNVALRFVSEVEVVAFMNFASMQPFL